MVSANAATLAALALTPPSPTPLPGTPGVVSLPTGLIDSLNGMATAVPSINPTLISGDLALQLTATALPPNCVLHRLAEGEFPSSIAEQYGANLDDLMAVNGLTEESATFLQVGDVLIVPLPGCALVTAQMPNVTATRDRMKSPKDRSLTFALEGSASPPIILTHIPLTISIGITVIVNTDGLKSGRQRAPATKS